MSKRVPFGVRYKHPLPVHSIELPPLIPHNPVSWVWCAWVYFRSTMDVSRVTVRYRHGCFVVEDRAEMEALWSQGFFGKGMMSRSDPSWYDRTLKRLGVGEFKHLTMEEVTALRREERKKFKKERAKLEKKQAELKKMGVVDPFLEERLKLRELRDKDITVNLERETFVREEDEVLMQYGELVSLESLQLQPQEALFLQFALQSVDVIHDSSVLSTSSLLDLAWPSRQPDDPFILNYVVYHHYRSHGWCVRSAIKFGVDWLLYKRGPPFQHAEFALLVLPNYVDESQNEALALDYTHLSGLNRVVAGVRKNLVLVYVTVPTHIDPHLPLQDLLSLYSINEVLYRRWVPNKNRS